MATVNLDTAARLDIICRRGDSFKLEIDFNEEVPTSGWKMDVLTSTGGTSILADTVFSYPVTNGEETNSKLTIEATASEMLVNAGLYVYDLQNTDSNTDVDGASKVKTYTYGTFKVVGDITS